MASTSSGMGVVMGALHNVVPGVVEKMMGTQTHIAQIEKAPPAAPTSGTVHEPSPDGTGVYSERLHK